MNLTTLSSFIIIETKVFLWGAFGLLAWQIITGKIKLGGLLRDKERGLPISPVRVQALASTLGVALYLLTQAAAPEKESKDVYAESKRSMPSVPDEALLLLGGSQMLYLTMKAGAAAGRLM
ncbi:MAG TPA: hypothetical protein DDZ88_24225 [Verrucomicrobiales bacterium]|nr:hypothetical protein [Verrucomicrobiales bacterium]